MRADVEGFAHDGSAKRSGSDKEEGGVVLTNGSAKDLAGLVENFKGDRRLSVCGGRRGPTAAHA